MKKSLLTLLTTLTIISIVATSTAITGTTYTWEKTFEVKKPEINCKIKIGEPRIIGCPVNIWVWLRINGCGTCCRTPCPSEPDVILRTPCERAEDCYKEYCDDCKNCCTCHCQINGTYSAHLYWWNTTQEDWQHITQLQEETNITITCWWQTHKYTFTPQWEGEYKVVVNFTMNSEAYTFTNED
jgi:hypothetical protein